MEIKIVYDNKALPGFKKGWGFSCLIEINKTKVLFDTANGPGFLINLEKFGINPDIIEHVILSHPHSDHMGGLMHLINRNLNFTLYIPSFFPTKLKLKIMSYCKTHETFGFEQVVENVYVDIASNHISEQFCMVELDQGILVITGCAHPGLDTILKKASQYDKPLYGVIGGFHGFKKLNFLKDLSFIAPCHCTEYKKAILDQYPKIAHPCASGSVFKL